MSKYGLIINTCFYKNNQKDTFNYTLDTLEECKNKLIITLKIELYEYKFDFTENFEDIENYLRSVYDWQSSNTNTLIDYYIFNGTKWLKPWSIQEIYENVVDTINKLDIQKAILNKYEDIYYEETDENCYGETNENCYEETDETCYGETDETCYGETNKKQIKK